MEMWTSRLCGQMAMLSCMPLGWASWCRPAKSVVVLSSPTSSFLAIHCRLSAPPGMCCRCHSRVPLSKPFNSKLCCRALEIAKCSDAVLVVGSSLQVYSAYRLVKAAQAQGAKLAIVNAGSTRADSHADLKLDVLAGEALSRLAAHPAFLVPAVRR